MLCPVAISIGSKKGNLVRFIGDAPLTKSIGLLVTVMYSSFGCKFPHMYLFMFAGSMPRQGFLWRSCIQLWTPECRLLASVYYNTTSLQRRGATRPDIRDAHDWPWPGGDEAVLQGHLWWWQDGHQGMIGWLVECGVCAQSSVFKILLESY